MTRKYQRAAVELEIAIALDGHERTSATCRDVSIGGAFIVCPSAVETSPESGTGLTVFLSLPGFDDEVAIRGTMRWATSDGMGVQFEPVGPDETRAFVELLKAR